MNAQFGGKPPNLMIANITGYTVIWTAITIHTYMCTCILAPILMCVCTCVRRVCVYVCVCTCVCVFVCVCVRLCVCGDILLNPCSQDTHLQPQLQRHLTFTDSGLCFVHKVAQRLNSLTGLSHSYFKCVCSSGDHTLLFPADTDPQLCRQLAVIMANRKAAHWTQGESYPWPFPLSFAHLHADDHFHANDSLRANDSRLANDHLPFVPSKH